MKVNETEKVEYARVVLEKNVDFNDGDLEKKCQTTMGHRKFTDKFMEKFPETVGYDEIVMIGMCSDEQMFVNATLIRWL